MGRNCVELVERFKLPKISFEKHTFHLAEQLLYTRQKNSHACCFTLTTDTKICKFSLNECKLHRVLDKRRLQITLSTCYTQMSQRIGTIMVFTVYCQIQVPTVSKRAMSTKTSLQQFIWTFICVHSVQTALSPGSGMGARSNRHKSTDHRQQKASQKKSLA